MFHILQKDKKTLDTYTEIIPLNYDKYVAKYNLYKVKSFSKK